ncbi:aminotransferase [Prauserella sp. PE36]|uniref:Aminotransferase class V-fold PLP-dependent enzyme n=1 Tax=Prauserella endophytica TaxID=1592324 RepID=A0ABY2RXF6_9PSEU|nr:MULTISPECIES: aminotransferase class V-fold PLP-dependent enzyme [Prauserella]PXY33130.1 aminotransferase class V [Prauserella coralliicola]RBM16317.1 aminotransferase [Prauserella sp. PE36]TKG62580.1 aminotransferase class V-fold PLP-dependent enzyme [Prauserella endophytica]
MRHAFDADFDVPPGYLNTPSIGIPPAHVADAVAETVARWRTGADAPPDFDAAVHTSREGFATLTGVPADRVAIGGSVSQAISVVAAGLPDGASVLVAEQEFTSVTFPFAAHRHRGVTVREVPLADLPSTVEGHDLVAVSVAQSADGALVDLAALRDSAASAGVPVLLDVTQAAGWLPLELEWADWVVGGSYKWLLAPRGAAWLAVHPRVLERGVPVAANWYAGEDPWQAVYGLPLRLAEGPRRYDLSPAWLCFAGAAVSLRYLTSLDRKAVHAHCTGLADRLRSGLGLPPAGSAIVALAVENAGPRLSEAGVRASLRAGRIRVGFHLYNTVEDVERVLDALA